MHEGVISRLGKPLIAELYRHLAGRPDSLVLVDVGEDGEVAGFIASLADGRGLMSSFLLTHWFTAFRHFVAIAATRPRDALGLLYLTRHLAGGRRTGADTPGFEILSLAVVPDRTRQGMATALFSALSCALLERGTTRLKVSAAATQTAAHYFYVNVGGKKEADIRVGNLPATVYVFDLTAAPSKIAADESTIHPQPSPKS